LLVRLYPDTVTVVLKVCADAGSLADPASSQPSSAELEPERHKAMAGSIEWFYTRKG